MNTILLKMPFLRARNKATRHNGHICMYIQTKKLNIVYLDISTFANIIIYIYISIP